MESLASLVQADLLEQPLQLVELGGAARLLVHEPRRVAGHAQPLESAHEPLLLQGGERPFLEDGEQPGHGALRVVVVLTLLRRHRNGEPRDEPLRKVREHLLLAPPQHHGRDPGSEEVQVPVAGWAAGRVELRELLVEAPERPEQVRIDDLHQAVEIVEPVLERRAGEHEGEAALDALHDRCRPRAPVLDALRLVEDDEIGGEVEDLPLVGASELVARDEDGRGVGVASPSLLAPARDDHDVVLAEVGELTDLAQPLVLERRRANNERAPHLTPPRELRQGGNGLCRLPEPHLVGEERPPAGGEEGDAFHLVRVELHAEARLVAPCRAHLLPHRAATLGLPLRLQRPFREAGHLGRDLDAGLHRFAREVRPGVGQRPRELPVGAEVTRGHAPLGCPRSRHEAHCEGHFRLEEEVEVARRRPIRERPLQAPGGVGAQVAEHGLDVLAGAEEVRREVGAVAAVVRRVERAQRDPVRLRRRGGHAMVAVEARAPVPFDLEELRAAARLSPAPLLLTQRRGRLLRAVPLLRPRQAGEEQRQRRSVPAALLAATTARSEPLSPPGQAHPHDTAAIGDGGVGPRGPERRTRHSPRGYGLAARRDRFFREDTANDGGGEAIDDGRGRAFISDQGHGGLREEDPTYPAGLTMIRLAMLPAPDLMADADPA